MEIKLSKLLCGFLSCVKKVDCKLTSFFAHEKDSTCTVNMTCKYQKQ